MSITDELREYAEENECESYCKLLLAIADRIDERYHRDMATAQQVGYNEGEDAAMRDGWVKLPVDADGEIIHIGDNMTNDTDLPARVRQMVLGEHGWKMASVFAGDSKTVLPTDLHHVKPDTWERIIEDALALGAEFEQKNIVTTALNCPELVERCRRLAAE